MAQIIRYVDPDAAGGGTGLDWTNAYNSLNACEAAQQQDLTDAGGDYMTIYCRSSGGTDDTTSVDFLGWTTNATCYIEIIQSDFPTNGILDTSKYVLNISNEACIDIRENYVRLGPFQIQATETGTGTAAGVYVSNIDAGGSDIRVFKTIVKGICSGTGSGWGFNCIDADATISVYNCIAYGFISGEDTGFHGFSCSAATVINIYNCTSFGNYYGFARSNNVVNIYNCASFNNADDFAGAIAVIQNCASDDGDGVNPEDFTAEAVDWNKVFTDYTVANVSLKDYVISPCCVGQGTDNPGAGLYSDDTIGTARSSIWDIGAFEYGAAGTTVEPATLVAELTLQTPNIIISYTHEPTTFTLALTQEIPSVISSCIVEPATLALALTLENLTIISSYTAIPDVFTLTLDIPTHDLLFDYSLSVSTFELNLTLELSSLLFDYTVISSTFILTLILETPVVVLSTQTVLPDTFGLSLALPTPDIITGMIVEVNTFNLSLTQETLDLLFDYTLTPTTLTIVLTLLTPEILVPGITVGVSTLELILDLETPTVIISCTVLSNTLMLVITQQASSPTFSYTISMGSAFSLALTQQASSLSLGAAILISSAFELALTLQTSIVVSNLITVLPSPLNSTLSLQTPLIALPSWAITPGAFGLVVTSLTSNVIIGHPEITSLMQAVLIDPYSGGAWLWLVEILIPGYDIIRLACNTEDVVYAGNTYEKSNFEVGLQPLVSDGSVPQIMLRVAQSADHTLEDIINETQGGDGGSIKIIRTHEDFLTEFVEELEQEVNILTAESDTEHVIFSCGIPSPLLKKIPLRRYSSKSCPYATPSLFKGAECQYDGDDNTCTGKFEDCYTKDNVNHWGGEIGLDPGASRT